MFRFTIRELVLLTLVVAMSVGWWREAVISRERAGWRSKAETMGRALRERGWTVRFGNDSLDVRDENGNSIFHSH